MNLQLYIELLEKEVEELRLRRRTDELERQFSRHSRDVAPSLDKRRAGGVAGMVGLTEVEMGEAKEQAEREFNVPRNLQTDPTVEALDPA